MKNLTNLMKYNICRPLALAEPDVSDKERDARHLNFKIHYPPAEKYDCVILLAAKIIKYSTLYSIL